MEARLAWSRLPKNVYIHLNLRRDIPMRFMVIGKASKNSEAGIVPTQEAFAEMADRGKSKP
jgi:hypothetical protein